MIFKPFPFPAMKELSEVHLIHFPGLCSTHDNYFSALPFQNKHICSLMKRNSSKIHFPSWILCPGGGLQQCASWAWVIPFGWCHAPGWFRLPTMSLHESFSFPTDCRGNHQQSGSWSRWLSNWETQRSWIIAWEWMNRLWTQCCFLGFSLVLPLKQVEQGLNAVFIFQISRDITHVPRHEIWLKKKTNTYFKLPCSSNKLRPQSCAV